MAFLIDNESLELVPGKGTSELADYIFMANHVESSMAWTSEEMETAGIHFTLGNANGPEYDGTGESVKPIWFVCVCIVKDDYETTGFQKMQIAFPLNTANLYFPKQMYIRQKSNGTWSDWRGG